MPPSCQRKYMSEGCTTEIRFKTKISYASLAYFPQNQLVSKVGRCFLVWGATPNPFHVGHPQVQVMWSHNPYHVLHWLPIQAMKHVDWPRLASNMQATILYYTIVWAMGILFTDLYHVRSPSHVLNYSQRNQQDSRQYYVGVRHVKTGYESGSYHKAKKSTLPFRWSPCTSHTQSCSGPKCHQDTNAMKPAATVATICNQWLYVAST